MQRLCATEHSGQDLVRNAHINGQWVTRMVQISKAMHAYADKHGGRLPPPAIYGKEGQPLLFLSQCSRFAENEPIRGGIPVIFPWFGPREGMAQHGFARTKNWDLKEFVPAADGSVSVRLALPDCPEASGFPPFTADYIVTVNESLTLQLIVTNKSKTEAFTFENCLHTYFEVGSISGVSIPGLQGAEYLDKVADFAQKKEEQEKV